MPVVPFAMLCALCASFVVSVVNLAAIRLSLYNQMNLFRLKMRIFVRFLLGLPISHTGN